MSAFSQAHWMTPDHQNFLVQNAKTQFDFFQPSLCPSGGFYTLDLTGQPLPSAVQELHTTTRLVHSFALGKLAGRNNCDNIIDQGVSYLFSHHRDAAHGGYLWALEGADIHDGRKLAYGHVFVLLAASSALAVDHPDAMALLEDVDQILEQRFWEEDHGLFCDEFNADWTPFSTYRGMNANMHGIEALLAAFEATGREKYLDRASRILHFFAHKIAPSEGWRLPEHYMENWAVDRSYSGNPMFRPAGTTPGHSFEIARLLLQFNELCGQPNADRIATARTIAYRALEDAWNTEAGGFCYTLNFDGTPDITDRYWWPVTEAIGVLAALMKTDAAASDLEWYNRVWDFARTHFVDQENGGWFPEIDANGVPTVTQFEGKPDIYHSIQAVLFPLTPTVSGAYEDLKQLQL
ncbi:AGE family epimerase/isomerase [Cognatishimia activa]|uniref:Putative sugar isomerase YihS n=1 Tax=Cognatishimia activa TaxID=1715691 RepID=A0A0N7MBX4_9RHOB|nr:AGE family epimerase/isomerase [Cognatishimia activa]CUI72152.1 putative sugar isomerase YihS [Cognatishimia activa]CUK26616.1 putative sugar isomerase YihS [Cognatishimia activa]